MAPATRRPATADRPARRSSDDHRGRERRGCAGSRSADTGARARPSAPAPPRRPRVCALGRPAPSAPPKAACRSAAATGPGPSHPATASRRTRTLTSFLRRSPSSPRSRGHARRQASSAAHSRPRSLQPPDVTRLDRPEPLAPRVDRLLAHRVALANHRNADRDPPRAGSPPPARPKTSTVASLPPVEGAISHDLLGLKLREQVNGFWSCSKQGEPSPGHYVSATSAVFNGSYPRWRQERYRTPRNMLMERFQVSCRALERSSFIDRPPLGGPVGMLV